MKYRPLSEIDKRLVLTKRIEQGTRIVYHYDLATDGLGSKCTHCQSRRLAPHSLRKVALKDIPEDGQQTIARITLPRLYCNDCHRSSTFQLPNIYQYGCRTTNRLRYMVVKLDSYKQAVDCGVNAKNYYTWKDDYDLKKGTN